MKKLNNLSSEKMRIKKRKNYFIIYILVILIISGFGLSVLKQTRAGFITGARKEKISINPITEEDLIQDQEEICKPVKWIRRVKKVRLNKTIVNLTIKIPQEISKIKFNKIMDRTKEDINIYKINKEEVKKTIHGLITSYIFKHYTGIVYTTITESPKNLIKLYRITGRVREPAEIVSYTNENNNGLINKIEGFIPNLTNRTYEAIIEISKAEYLDENKNFISDIYTEVYQLDNIWSEPIHHNEYIRTTFEQNLTSERDITLYLRVVSGNPKIKVYEINSNNKIAEFTNIQSNQYNKVFLTNLVGSQDTFDLRILDGVIEIDHIVDPAAFVRSVETHRITMDNLTTTNSSNLGKSQNISNVVPFVTWSLIHASTTDNWQKFLLDVTLSPTQVKLTRNLGTLTPIEAYVSLVEFNPDYVRVQNGTFSIAASARTTTGKLNQSVNLSRSALIFHYQSTDATDDHNDNMVRGIFANSNTLNFDIGGTTGIKSGHWWVFESLDGAFTVQNVLINFTSTSVSATETIGEAQLDKTFLIASWKTDEISDDPGEGKANFNLTDTTTITGKRLGTCAARLNASVFAITFTGDETVQSGVFSPATGTSFKSATINEVNLSESMVTGAAWGYGPVASTSAADESSFYRLWLQDATNVSGKRDETIAAGVISWQVIDWVVGPLGGAPDTCTYSSGDWNVNCADNCVITSPTYLPNNKLNLYGTGTFTILADVVTGRLEKVNTCNIHNKAKDGSRLIVKL